MAERADKITAEFVPAPPVPHPLDKIVIKGPLGTNGYAIFQDLHLSIAQAIELDDVICEALSAYEDYRAVDPDA